MPGPGTLLDELLDAVTVDHPGHGYLLLLLRGRQTLYRSAEAETIYGLDHLRDGDLCGVECHDRFLRPEAHICPTHACQPFQGLLDRGGSGPSGHPVH